MVEKIVSFFSTSKGSIYSVYGNGSTQRFKMVDECLKEKSELTLYLNYSNTSFIASCLAEVGEVGFLISNDIMFIIVNDKEYGPIKCELQPAIGLSPIEFWGLEDRDVVKIPNSVHVGNEIDDIWKN